MPWKGEKDPYKIWLSEIILQQTRVAQGLPYYNSFIQHYPTIQDLAGATDTAVFKLWEGLGYYSRCRNLLACARQVMEIHDGIFPSNYEDIISLKGIGPYTAAAITSFAFDLPHAVVDGNVIRVLSRYFGIKTPFDTAGGKKEFFTLANALIVKAEPAAYNQAIMDFGAMVCTPSDPNCEHCPLQKGCYAFGHKLVKSFPVKGKKLVKKNRYLNYFIISTKGKTLVRQRQQKDIWQHLHEFFLVESASQIEWENVSVKQDLDFVNSYVTEVVHKGEIFRQQLTHQTVFAKFSELSSNKLFTAPEGYEWLDERQMNELAFPRLINAYLASARNAALSLF